MSQHLILSYCENHVLDPNKPFHFSDSLVKGNAVNQKKKKKIYVNLHPVGISAVCAFSSQLSLSCISDGSLVLCVIIHLLFW